MGPRTNYALSFALVWCSVTWSSAALAEAPGEAAPQADPAAQPPQEPTTVDMKKVPTKSVESKKIAPENAGAKETAKAGVVAPPIAEPPRDPFDEVISRSRPRAGSQAEDDAAHPEWRGATFVKDNAVIETVTVHEGLVETTTIQQISGTKKIKRHGAIECGEHKRLTISNVAIVTDGVAVEVSGKCQVTLVNSFIVSRSGPAIVIKGKRARVTLDHCSVVGTKADGATLAARVGRRSRLESTRTHFTGGVASRKRDFRKTDTQVDVPADELKKKKTKKKRRKKKKRRSRKS